MTATLDPASRDGARALERFATEKIGWLTTVNADGQPQSSPLWFLWTGDEIFVYASTRAEAEKAQAVIESQVRSLGEPSPLP